MGRGLFPVVSQYLQQQYPAEGQAKGNNEFINNPFHQLPRTSISIRVFQNIFFIVKLFTVKTGQLLSAGRVKN